MSERETVEYLDPPDDPIDHAGPLREIEVTAYRTTQRIRTAVFAVPVELADADVNAYLERMFDWLGLYEIFDQEARYCIRDDDEDVDWTDIVDEPHLGYEWRERT